MIWTEQCVRPTRITMGESFSQATPVLPELDVLTDPGPEQSEFGNPHHPFEGVWELGRHSRCDPERTSPDSSTCVPSEGSGPEGALTTPTPGALVLPADERPLTSSPEHLPGCIPWRDVRGFDVGSLGANGRRLFVPMAYLKDGRRYRLYAATLRRSTAHRYCLELKSAVSTGDSSDSQSKHHGKGVLIAGYRPGRTALRHARWISRMSSLSMAEISKMWSATRLAMTGLRKRSWPRPSNSSSVVLGMHRAIASPWAEGNVG